ncbi:hypothetical protein DL768_010417 [Monosporascus sp. mg162]|nr:hypothetical protein DL768_010417 [Monosporascus sp. mg162]
MARLLRLFARASVFAAIAQAQIQLLNITAGSTIPTTCRQVLTQTVACNKQLLHAKEVGVPVINHFYSAEALTNLCTNGCTAALSTWLRRVTGACANVRIPTNHGTLMLVSALAEQYVEAYSSYCLRDGGGNLCNTVLGKAAGIDPVAQVPTASAASNRVYLINITLLDNRLVNHDSVANLLGDPVAKSAGVQQVQLISWNLELGMDCSKMSSQVGYVICVSNPGGDWVNPSPMPPVTSTSFESIPAVPMTPVANMPVPTNIGWNDTIEVAPFAEGTRQDCELYIQPPILMDWRYSNYSSDCEDVAAQYGVELDDLKTWNPSLSTNCTLSNDAQYCVLLAEEEPPEVTEYCAQYALVESGYDCDYFAASYGVERDQFVLWNPSVGSECENFRNGIVSTCNSFVVANDTEWANDPCTQIETKFGLSHARFVAWNPAVKTNCTGLYLGYDYCVSIPGYKPTYTTPALPSAT